MQGGHLVDRGSTSTRYVVCSEFSPVGGAFLDTKVLAHKGVGTMKMQIVQQSEAQLAAKREKKAVARDGLKAYERKAFSLMR
jgi:hypothetical protein